MRRKKGRSGDSREKGGEDRRIQQIKQRRRKRKSFFVTLLFKNVTIIYVLLNSLPRRRAKPRAGEYEERRPTEAGFVRSRGRRSLLRPERRRRRRKKRSLGSWRRRRENGICFLIPFALFLLLLRSLPNTHVVLYIRRKTKSTLSLSLSFPTHFLYISGREGERSE